MSGGLFKTLIVIFSQSVTYFKAHVIQRMDDWRSYVFMYSQKIMSIVVPT